MNLRPWQVEKLPGWGIDPMKRGRGARRTEVIGFDSESDAGRPFLLTFSRADTSAEDVDVREVSLTHLAALHTFMRFVATLTRRDTEYVIVAYNLRYEFGQLFGDLLRHGPEYAELVRSPEFVLPYNLGAASPSALNRRSGPHSRRFSLSVWQDRRVAMLIRDEASQRVIRVIDAQAWYKGGLDRVSRDLGFGGKAPRPWRKITRDLLAVPAFMEYARKDAWLTRRIGEAIIGTHVDFDVPTCISGPQMASRIFRRQFLRTTIPLVSEDLEGAGLASLHGGKLGFYAAQPGRWTDVWHYDMNSAYGAALASIPDPTRATWRFSPSYVAHVHGLWRISFGRTRGQTCTYRPPEPSGFPASAYLTDVWLTSYELDAMLELGEIDVTSVSGYIMEGPQGGPFAAYVNYLYDRKRRSGGAAREAIKLLLVSLSGKLAQRNTDGALAVGVPVEGLDHPPVGGVMGDTVAGGTAGGLYAPHLYALVTGWVRARIHRLEHRYGAILTSVDGFVAYRGPEPGDCGPELGQLRAHRGTLTAWRPRLYIFDADDGTRHAAMHGFPGTLADLMALPLATGTFVIPVERPTTLRRTPSHLAPGTFRETQATITIDTS